MGTNTDAPHAYVGNYDVEANYGADDDVLLTGSFEVYAVDSGPGGTGPVDGSDQAQLGNAADPTGNLAKTGTNTALVLAAIAAFPLLVGGALPYTRRRRA